MGMPTTITAIDDQTINLSINSPIFNVEATYRQVEPYVFQMISTDSYALLMRHPELHFVVENGSPVVVLSGNGWDLTPMRHPMPVAIAGLVVFLITSTYFFELVVVRRLIAPLRKLFARIRKKEVAETVIPDTPFYRARGLVLLTGAILATNCTIAMLGSPLVIVHVMINYAMLALSVFAIPRSILAFKAEEVDKKERRKYIIAVVFLVLLLVTAWQWNFFNF